MNKARRNTKTPYLGDNKLLNRVRQYLDTVKHEKYVDVMDVMSHLQKSYSEYPRKNRIAFKTSIEKVLEIIRRERQDNNESESLYSDLELSETNYDDEAKKHDKKMAGNKNLVNSSIHALYSKPSGNQPRSRNRRENSTPSGHYWAEDRLGTETVDFIPLDTNHSPSIMQKEQISGTSRKRKSEAVLEGDSNRKKTKSDVPLQTSTVTFADVGGCEKSLLEICKLLFHMKHPEVYETLGVKPPRGFLLHGPPGCGKTLLAHAIAGEFDIPFIKIAATEIVSGVSGESEEKIRELFEKAIASAPCILFIDEIDSITPKRETAQREMERRIVAQLLSCMDELNSKSFASQVLVIGATNRPDSLDPALRRAGRFDHEVSLGIPDEEARERILKVLCKDLRLSPDFNFNTISRNSPGFVGADLMALTREAAMHAVNRTFSALQALVSSVHSLDQLQCSSAQPAETHTSSVAEPPETKKNLSSELQTMLQLLEKETALTEDQLKTLFVNMGDFNSALKTVQPSSKREGFATIPNTTWEDIGALQNIREELQITILAPIKYPEQFEMLGLTNPAGVLLYGPPGCGKTMLAKAIANETGVNFISVKGPELLNMYVGESERAVRQCFQRARASAPCVIFFDELDALCPKRSDSAESGSSARVVNQLLTEMDGLEARKNVFIIGATNRPDIIDSAILRPGRLDKSLYVGLPSPQARVEILQTITKNGTIPKVSEDVDLKSIGCDAQCNGYTGADLAALVREASITALKENLASLVVPCSSAITVTMNHFTVALARIRPSVSAKDQLMYELMQDTFSMKQSC